MKKAFTLIEMMIVIVIIGAGLLGVISTISSSYKFLYNTKNNITAINIARAGMEEVFNIRNTNWKRWSGKKDLCWLKINPLLDNGNDGCENDDWFEEGSYVIVSTGTDQKYFALQKQSVPLNTTGDLVSNDWNYLVCKDSNGIVAKCNPTPSSRPSNYFDSLLYFQQVRGGYLLDKQDTNGNGRNISCSNGNDVGCGDGRSLEKNFCVDVVYFDGNKNKVTFCSSLTNFRK